MKKLLNCIFIFCFLFLTGCDKNYLNSINDKSLLVPETLEDLEAIINNDKVMNGVSLSGGSPLPALSATATDDFYLDDQIYNMISESSKKNYRWELDEDYDNETIANWSRPYVVVFYSNIVLNKLENIKKTNFNQNKWNRIKGSALFFRAYSYFFLSQLFMPDYDFNNSEILLGLPLRTVPDVSVKIRRSSLKQTYEFMIKDLEESLTLLPTITNLKTSPSKCSSYALLSRIYLIMEDYEKSNLMANKALNIQNNLIDYNNLNTGDLYPITKLNDEVIFHSLLTRNLIEGYGIVNNKLLSKYEQMDLRKQVYFNSKGNFRGSYDGSSGLFGGITTSEILLIRAETNARLNNTSDAINDLNLLLQNRFIKGKFENYYVTSNQQVLDLIINHRKLEMVNRGLGWSDLRRLNREDRYKTTLLRTINGVDFKLNPEDTKRFVFMIPKQSIEYSNLIQN